MTRAAICLVSSVVVCLASAAAVGAQADGVVTLRTSGQFVSAGDDPTGFDVDLLTRFAAWYKVRHGEALDLARATVTTVPDLLDAVQNGGSVMGLGGITITAARDEVVDFTEPYLPVRMVLIAPPGRIPAPWQEGLVGKRIGAITGSTNAAAAEELADDVDGLVVDTSFPTNADLFRVLHGGDLDGAVVDVTHYWAMGKEQNVTLVTPVGPAQGLGVVLPPGSELKAEWDDFLENFTHTSTYFQLIRKYFGSDAEEMVRVAKGD